MNNRPDPSGCRSTGRSRPEISNRHVYALESGNEDALAGVSVAGVCVGVGVRGIAVGGAEVEGIESGKDVEGNGVLNPLQAGTRNANKIR